MRSGDAPAVSGLADRLIGWGYYPPELVLADLERSIGARGVVCSHVAELADQPGCPLVGFRIALPPGSWQRGRGRGLKPSAWPAPLEACGYFQSAFVATEHTGRGIGPEMARMALDALRACGARAVVTHCWKESPHGSSQKYLERLGFVAVAEHPEYWVDVDYVCSLDGKPCHCTSIEMVLAKWCWSSGTPEPP
jgi:ribosomal protein S18 acetylase RimI-like enzyme